MKTKVAGARAVTALVFALACAALASGSRFDLDPFDSAELALVAVTGGLGHPPGQPLHTALGWLVTRGPWRPLAALAWLSIGPVALALALSAGRTIGARAVPWTRAIALIALAAIPCALPHVRDVACRIEVYALAAALSVGGLLVSVRRTARADLAAGALIGLAAAANPVVAAQGAGVLLLAARARGGARGSAAAVLRASGAGALAALGVYLYAFAVAGRGAPALVWGPPRDLTSFISLVSARDFQHNVSLSPGVLASNLARLAWDLARAGALPYLALGAWGLFAKSRNENGARDPLLAPFAIALTAGAVMIASNTPYRGANPDYGGYLLVPLALSYAGAARAVLAAPGDPWRAPLIATLAAITAILSVPRAIALGRPSGAVRAIASEVLASAPRGALLVLASDHVLFPALYLQSVERARVDVTVLNPGWASSAWAWRRAMASDRALRVDLTPGLGGPRRLALALRARPAGRAVASETLEMLRAAAGGPVCPVGIAWSSPEGCSGPARAPVERARRAIAREAARATSRSWDERVVLYTALAVGRDALTLGCPGLAAQYYSAGLAREAPAWAAARLCGRTVAAGTAIDLLAVERADLERELSRVAP